MGWANGYDPIVARYEPIAGALDTTYDGDGLSYTDFGLSQERFYGVAISSDSVWAVGEAGGDFAIARLHGGGLEERLYVQQDATFNVTSLVGYDSGSSSWIVKQRFEYDAYGVATILDASTWASTSDSYSWAYRFQGLRYDATSDTSDARNRIYIMRLGRFGQPDHVMQYADGSNLYEFVSSNPVGSLDPFGLHDSKPPTTRPTTFPDIREPIYISPRCYDCHNPRMMFDPCLTWEELSPNQRSAIMRWGASKPKYEAVLLGGIELGADVAGTVDPTGTVDGITSGLLLAGGRPDDAALTAAGAVPVVGDILGKGGKWCKRIGKFVKGLFRGTDGGKAATKIADGKITGYTQHGLNQAMGRDGGAGVKGSAILDAVKHPKSVVQQANGKVKYIGNDATVITNSDGKIITTWGNSRGGLRHPREE